MELGQFSVSLTVKDLQASKAFYAKLGFEMLPGLDFQTDDQESQYDKNWVILTNGTDHIGLFQGMFDKNVLTWNPKDARAVQKRLKEQGVELISEADESTTGPCSLTMLDPDGNPILIDQH